MGRENPKKLVKSQENAKLENGSRIPKESNEPRIPKDERNGTKEPTSNVMGQEIPK